MKKFVSYAVTIIFSIFVGCALMYALIYFFPNTIIKTITKEQKVVNVVDDGIAEGINAVYNSVVVVESYKNSSVSSTGSGFAFKSDKEYTYIMTNNHVISTASNVVVSTSDGTEIEASIVGADEYSDIAVLKIKNSEKLEVSTMGTIEDVQVGDTVFAVGSPVGKEFSNTVTRGILSGKDRLIETTISNNEKWLMNVMQTDAAINPGNSGGPLCDASGKVIGINSLKIVESSVEGLGFAIPIDDALSFAESLIKNGKITRGYIGISMLNASEKFQLLRNGIEVPKDVDSGVVVVEVMEDSPAEEAKLEKGDVIYKINDKDIKSISTFRYNLYKYFPGDEVKLSVYRDGESKEIKVKIKASE